MAVHHVAGTAPPSHRTVHRDHMDGAVMYRSSPQPPSFTPFHRVHWFRVCAATLLMPAPAAAAAAAVGVKCAHSPCTLTALPWAWRMPRSLGPRIPMTCSTAAAGPAALVLIKLSKSTAVMRHHGAPHTHTLTHTHTPKEVIVYCFKTDDVMSHANKPSAY